jgi:hypothetical protein
MANKLVTKHCHLGSAVVGRALPCLSTADSRLLFSSQRRRLRDWKLKQLPSHSLAHSPVHTEHHGVVSEASLLHCILSPAAIWCFVKSIITVHRRSEKMRHSFHPGAPLGAPGPAEK